jgi:hypothetical protein
LENGQVGSQPEDILVMALEKKRCTPLGHHQQFVSSSTPAETPSTSTVCGSRGTSKETDKQGIISKSTSKETTRSNATRSSSKDTAKCTPRGGLLKESDDRRLDDILVKRVSIAIGDAEGPEQRPTPQLTRKFLVMYDMLLRCQFTTADIVCFVSYALVYYERISDTICEDLKRKHPEKDLQVSKRERVNWVMILCFIAHVHVADEVLLLRAWHKRLFKHKCDLRTLNSAVLRFLQYLGWKLSVEDVFERYERLSEGCEDLIEPLS